MKLAATAFVFLFLQAVPVPSQQQPQALTGIIEGLVLRADSDEPIAKAQVTLTRVVTPPAAGLAPAAPPTPPPPIPPATTDNAGRFAFRDLEPGSYRIVAGRNGFVRQDHGARTAGAQGAPVNLPPGQTMKDITFRLIQTATVSGRVRTSSGQPGAGLGVQLVKAMYNVTGQRTFQAMGSVRTDDRGEYRLFWITPGRYYLAVSGGRNALLEIALLGGSSPNEVPVTGQPTVYYPGTSDPLRASAIEVGPGGELPSVDVVLPEQLVYRVRGRVVDTSSGQAPRTASVTIVPRDPAFTSLTLTSSSANYSATTGTFDLRDVVPGSYWIRAQAIESTVTAVIPANAVGRTLSDALSTLQGPRMAAQRPLDVTGDIEGIVLELSPGVSIPGSLRVEGPPLPTTPVPRVALRPTTPSGLASPLLPINADGTFTLTNVLPGEYRVNLLPMPLDFYIKEARIEQNDVLNQPWVITGPVRGNLSVVLSGSAGQVEGTVVDSRSQPVSAIQAVLIPDQYRDRTELFKFSVTDREGRFTLRGITPGGYKLFAWEAIEANAFFDPEVLRQFEQQGKAVRVVEGGKVSSEVRMIPATK